ncbi:hypothetical protein LZ559_26600 [Streptomyces sp. R527F]|nr:hypothetical protein LZ559_26600 [Streptomyces sp. R527F]
MPYANEPTPPPAADGRRRRTPADGRGPGPRGPRPAAVTRPAGLGRARPERLPAELRPARDRPGGHRHRPPAQDRPGQRAADVLRRPVRPRSGAARPRPDGHRRRQGGGALRGGPGHRPDGGDAGVEVRELHVAGRP